MVTVRLADHGVSFATRERAAAIAHALGKGDELELSFAGVRAASPSFLDGFFAGIEARYTHVRLEDVPPTIETLVGAVIKRRALDSRFRILAKA